MPGSPSRPGDGAWRDMVVLCAANNWDDVKLADRHLAERLSAHVPLLYVDPPMSHLTPRHRPELAPALRPPHLRLVGPGLARLTPLMPPRGQRRGMVPLTNRLVRRALRRAVEQLDGQVGTLITTWHLLDVYGACDESRRVYWWQDDPGAAAELWGADEGRLVRGERRLAEGADLVVVVNENAAERFGEAGRPVRYIPNGCDAERFAHTDEVEAARDVGLSPPVAGFIGHLNRRTDLALLEAVADRGVSLLLVGPRDPSFEPARVDALVRRSNVAWVGRRPFDELPAYLRLIDVGVVPYARSRFNDGSFPLKTLEYLSAGRPVVATPLPATSSLGTDFIALADRPDSFADAVVRAFPGARDPEAVRRRRAFAASHSWTVRAADFASALDDLAAAGSGLRSGVSV